jgi:hypothetical protein
LGGDVNLYGYVGNDPIDGIDPLGLFGIEDLPTIPAPVVNAVAGFGDAFLIPIVVRSALDLMTWSIGALQRTGAAWSEASSLVAFRWFLGRRRHRFPIFVTGISVRGFRTCHLSAGYSVAERTRVDKRVASEPQCRPVSVDGWPRGGAAPTVLQSTLRMNGAP